MIIKPWTDLPPPRHLLEEDVEDEDAAIDTSATPITELHLHNPSHNFEYLIVVPSTLTKIVTSVGSATRIGHIKVDLSTAGAPLLKQKTTTDYDEDIQLYPGTHTDTLQNGITLDINSIGSVAFVSVPSYTTNFALTNAVAAQLVPKLAFDELITVSIDNNLEEPHVLSNGIEIADLGVPHLAPPQYISSAVSAFISKAVVYHRPSLNFVTNDSLGSVIEVCHILQKLLRIKKKDYIDTCYKSLSYGNSNNGLYV